MGIGTKLRKKNTQKQTTKKKEKKIQQRSVTRPRFKSAFGKDKLANKWRKTYRYSIQHFRLV